MCFQSHPWLVACLFSFYTIPIRSFLESTAFFICLYKPWFVGLFHDLKPKSGEVCTDNTRARRARGLSVASLRLRAVYCEIDGSYVMPSELARGNLIPGCILAIVYVRACPSRLGMSNVTLRNINLLRLGINLLRLGIAHARKSNGRACQGPRRRTTSQRANGYTGARTVVCSWRARRRAVAAAMAHARQDLHVRIPSIL